MAKSVVNMSLIASIAAGTTEYISQADAAPLISHNPPLIAVDTTKIVDNNAKVWLTDAGKALVDKPAAKAGHPVYAIISNAVLPKKTRKGGGNSGAPTVYPWATMDVGATFFVPVSAEKPDPVKSMTSAVSSANMKFRVETGESKTVTSAKRGPKNKPVLDADGKKVMETTQRPIMKAVRKFHVGAVEAGKVYGGWTAPADGALVGRVM